MKNSTILITLFVINIIIHLAIIPEGSQCKHFIFSAIGGWCTATVMLIFLSKTNN